MSSCQWIFGDPPQHIYCGDPVRPGSSYCPKHHARCYRPAGEPSDRPGRPGGEFRPAERVEELERVA